MEKYTVWVDIRDENGELVDDFKEWTYANSGQEALQNIRREYPNESKYFLSLM